MEVIDHRIFVVGVIKLIKEMVGNAGFKYRVVYAERLVNFWGLITQEWSLYIATLSVVACSAFLHDDTNA